MKHIFRWDENKARVNLAKHKVGFEGGKTIFYDPFILTFRDDFDPGDEDHLISMGASTNERLLLAVHLEREETSESVFILLIVVEQRFRPGEGYVNEANNIPKASDDRMFPEYNFKGKTGWAENITWDGFDPIRFTSTPEMVRSRDAIGSSAFPQWEYRYS